MPAYYIPLVVCVPLCAAIVFLPVLVKHIVKWAKIRSGKSSGDNTKAGERP